MASIFLPKIISILKHQKGMEEVKEGFLPYHVPFRWKIYTSKGEVSALVFVPKNLDDMPLVKLESHVSQKPLPHVMSDRFICYLDRNSFVFDQFTPINQTIACLDKAKEVIKKIFNNEYQADLYSEFGSYWHKNWLPQQERFEAFVDICHNNTSSKLQVLTPTNCLHKFYITDDIKKFKEKMGSRFHLFCDAILLETNSLCPADPWPPSQGHDFLKWLGKQNKKLRTKLIGKVLPNSNELFKLVLLKSEQGIFAAGFAFDSKKSKTSRHERLFNSTVYLMTTSRIDVDFVCSRNIPTHQNLQNKKIALIGCGSVGGFLADLLCKLGAGCGNGILCLIDNEELEASNIGRHLLGYPSINKPKAEALSQELNRLIPTLNIEHRNIDAKNLQVSDLISYDLIIDATGEEGIGNHLCSILTDKNLLSVWIEGNGLAARALLHHSHKQACYHCIRHYEQDGKLLAIKNNPGVILNGGCRTPYVTYPVMAAVEAANLGATMTLDWANDILEPSFRTRLIDTSKELETFDCNPTPHPKCPVCNPST